MAPMPAALETATAATKAPDEPTWRLPPRAPMPAFSMCPPTRYKRASPLIRWGIPAVVGTRSNAFCRARFAHLPRLVSARFGSKAWPTGGASWPFR